MFWSFRGYTIDLCFGAPKGYNIGLCFGAPKGYNIGLCFGASRVIILVCVLELQGL